MSKPEDLRLAHSFRDIDRTASHEKYGAPGYHFLADAEQSQDDDNSGHADYGEERVHFDEVKGRIHLLDHLR